MDHIILGNVYFYASTETKRGHQLVEVGAVSTRYQKAFTGYLLDDQYNRISHKILHVDNLFSVLSGVVQWHKAYSSTRYHETDIFS